MRNLREVRRRLLSTRNEKQLKEKRLNDRGRMKDINYAGEAFNSRRKLKNGSF